MAMTAWAAKFKQLDLLVGKGPDFLAKINKCADQLVLLQHWNSQIVRIPPSSTAATHYRIPASM